MVTIAECLLASSQLHDVTDSARLDTEILLARAIDKPRSFLYAWPEKLLTEAQYVQFKNWLQRRSSGEPIAYIVGEKEFWSLPLSVNNSTIIPRPETELLVETVLGLLPQTQQNVLDLGTGTGAVALALASERPDWQILAVDNSPKAVQLAIENCRALGFDNMAINRSDWYSNIRNQTFDAIVCNPPYIDERDQHLSQGDVRFEPESALVAKDMGMADIIKVVNGARDYLNDAGWLLVEHGWNQGEKVRALFQTAKFSNIATKQDLAGLDRITLGQALGELR